MTNNNAQPDETIINVIRKHTSGYANTDYSVRHAEEVGSGRLYTVPFKGQDGHWRENYVFERKGKFKPYSTIRDVLLDASNGLISSWKNPDFVKLLVVSGLTIIFAAAVVGIVIWNPENKSLQVLTGLLGLTLGYFVGRNDDSSG